MDADIVARLRVLLGKCNIAPAMGVWSRDLRDAADEIERLRAERDEARREACLFKSRRKNGVMSPMEIARLRGWDCFKEER